MPVTFLPVSSISWNPLSLCLEGFLNILLLLSSYLFILDNYLTGNPLILTVISLSYNYIPLFLTPLHLDSYILSSIHLGNLEILELVISSCLIPYAWRIIHEPSPRSYIIDYGKGDPVVPAHYFLASYFGWKFSLLILFYHILMLFLILLSLI